MSALASHEHSPDILKFPAVRRNSPKPDNCPTLREVYQRHYLPTLGKRARKTLTDYNTILNDWERLTDNQPVNVINRSFLTSFQTQLSEELIRRGKNSPHILRSPATVNKKFRVLKPLVEYCFPPDRSNPEGMGIVKYCLFPESLEEKTRIPKTYSGKQIRALMHATFHKSIIWPFQETSLMWQTIIVCGWNFGARTYDLFDLCWEDVDFTYNRGQGAVRFTACKTSKLQRIPMHPIARSYLLKLKSRSSTDAVFPQFHKTNSSSIYRNWKKLLSAAGLPLDYHLEDFRKTANTRYETEVEGSGKWILGHSLKGVNAKNYYDPTPKVFKAIRRHKQPKAFKEILSFS